MNIKQLILIASTRGHDAFLHRDDQFARTRFKVRRRITAVRPRHFAGAAAGVVFEQGVRGRPAVTEVRQRGL